ncbi:MAG: NAD-dependent epimerase/dehydratase family protein [Gammaproteobacteria bacterium]|nr:NAD-dependent epimerase/dehydratase family protein [Gammaproteobacteria bacterium]MCW8986446.1 NAD-dependent epimerase/dehydratase family protein [Gammaproteobacteria bacterium]MCW9030421.1 NAD-dependent epimerase/dehydratase family protein [Gammaproteobacteria bacterium]
MNSSTEISTTEISKDSKIVIPGAAGLVGQNLIVFLIKAGYTNIVAIDKHKYNTRMLAQLHPGITVIEADLADKGEWQASLKDADMIIMLQAQIGGLTIEPFIRNNVTSTENILQSARQYNVPYIVHISSSVLESEADDFYTQTKEQQENLVINSGIAHCILRPTLMFGWFDRKHLGWLSRFMAKIPVFPIPSHGRFMRQPLYVGDFCNIIISAMHKQPKNKIYNITGREKIDYVDIIKGIKKTLGLRTWIMHIPYWLFWMLLKIYAIFDRDPPFTTSQLKALVIREEFELIPWWDIFEIKSTPFDDALKETYLDETYSKHVLHF